MGDEIIATAAPVLEETVQVVSEISMSAVLKELENIAYINTSIYNFVAYFVIIFFCAVIVYLILHPLIYFFR